MKISLEQHEAQWRRVNGCSAERRVYRKHGSSVCYTWDCDTPFVSCHLDGGHNWPLAGKRIFDFSKCDGEPADFPYADEVLRFFARLDPMYLKIEVAAPGAPVDLLS